MSVAWVGAGIAAVSAISSSSAGRSAQSQASDANAQALAAQEAATNERLAFDKQVYADGAEDRKWASDNARQMATWQGEDRTKYNKLQDEQVARGRKYQFAEDGILAEAGAFDTEGKREELAGKAMADVQQAYGSAEGQYSRNISRMGINPDSGRADASRVALGLSKANALAYAGTKARSDASTLGYARKMDAVALGKGLVGNQATQANLQLSSGNASVQNGQVPLSVASGANGAMSTGYGNAASGYSHLGGNQQQAFSMASNYGAGVANGVGNMFGQLSSNPYVVKAVGSLFTPSVSGSGISQSNASSGSSYHPSDNYGE